MPNDKAEGKLPHCTAAEVTYRCPFFDVQRTRATFDEFEKEYFVVKFGRRGGVVAVRDRRILLVQQYRFLIKGMSWELPGGTVEDAEDLPEGLRRECLEETGVLLRTLHPLIEYYPGLDNVDNRTTVFLCDQFSTAEQFHPTPAEITAIEWTPVERCMTMIFGGQILDAMTIAGLLAYSRRMGQ